MSGKWITVVGIGEDGLGGLAPAVQTLVEAAEVLVGGERHLSKVPEGAEIRIDWSNGFDAALDEMERHRGKNVVVLASGDPLNFGVGANIIRRFGIAPVTFLPTAGAYSLAAARMGWSLPDTKCLTVHGRPLTAVNLHLVAGKRLLILSRDAGTPAELAELLTVRGFGPSAISVLSNMGGDDVRQEGTAATWAHAPGADLNTIAVECLADKDADQRAWSRVPGLPDDVFEHDGQITKREVRAATLARLAPLPGRVLWDVGAGAGSIAIEWLRCEPSAKAVAIERDPVRAARIARNAETLGVPNLKIIEGEALAVLADIEPVPDVVFVGGGVSTPGLLEACWQALGHGGRLVANAVTVEAEQALFQFKNEYGGDLTRFAASRASPVGASDRLNTFKPMMEVTQLVMEKI
ncbi:MAG: precorrin-6y C5,15-methyltransferase (decarboxylating) subunit CbiE [Rhodospirillales bacterium]|nr:precorrin-6y C5,15-methyltransferase (decarboxylating) subunit CbiE [Rhodospirillales bacterium]